MDLEDKFLAKDFSNFQLGICFYPVSGVQSLSSSVQSTPEKNGNSDDASGSPELLQEFLKSGPKKELLRTCFDRDKKHTASSKSKATEFAMTGNKTIKKQESKKPSSSPNNQPPSKKQQRKGENPTRLVLASEQSSDFGCSSSWICKNSACRAVLSIDDTFCKRCSCCICHLFDDNKDPSLWLVCTSETGQGDSCGLSCHIECALQREKVGVVDLGQLMQLDGSYCCASCGKVSGILGCWKKQLLIAKEARRVDVLCYRIYLSYRLLDRTSRFKELHQIVREAKAKLETEVGPVNGVSAKMARGIVSRLSIAGAVQTLCSCAINKADEWLGTISSGNPNSREDSLPSACRFLFEDVTSSSVVIILIELCTASSDDIKGFKLWYCKSREETRPEEPICVFPRAERRILISNLQPCTEYTFRIVSYTEAGDFGHSEAKCFTKSIEIIHKNSDSSVAKNGKKASFILGGTSGSKRESKTTMAVNSSGFKVRELGKILHLAWAQEQGCLEGFCSADTEKCCGASKATMTETLEHQLPSVSRELDLNVVSVPDLNEDLTPPFESSRDEDNGCTLEQVVEADDDAASHDMKKNGLARSHGSGDSQTWTGGPSGEVPAVDSRTELCRKRAAHSNDEMHDCDSTLISGSPFRVSNGSGCLDENFEYCVKIIRWLECEGHINQEFRLKLLTWFSLRSTEQERRVVNTFIQTLIDEPSSLAGQLVDSFSDIISSKRPRNSFCSDAGGLVLPRKCLQISAVDCFLHRTFGLSRQRSCLKTEAASLEGASTVSSGTAENDVLKALSQIIDPDFGTDIVSCGFVKDLLIDEVQGEVSFRLELTTPACPIKDMFEQKANEVVASLPWVKNVKVTMSAQPARPIFAEQLPAGLQTISNIVAVSSCKGGVGKSTVAVNLAFTLAGMGARVGIFDADVYGPSLPTMVSPENRLLEMNPDKRTITPTEYLGVKLVSFGFAGQGRAIMRGPMVSGVINQLLTTTEWGELDYLVIDMPPGTGDIQLTLCQVVPLTAAVIVTTPQKLAFIDVAKGVRMFSKLKVPCIAVVENMCHFDADGKRYYPFGRGSGSQVVQQFGIPHLFDLPIRPTLSASGDSGMPEVVADPQGEVSKTFQDLGVCVVQQCAKIRQQVSTAVMYDKSIKAIKVKVPDSDYEFFLHPATVRRNDRSAQSVDEWTEEQKLQYTDVPEDIEPAEIRPMGNYAVQITWPDGFNQIAPYDQLQTMERLVGIPQPASVSA